MNFRKIIIQITCVVLIAFIASSLWSFTFGDNGLWNQHKLQRQIEHLKFETDSLKAILEFRKHEGERLLKDSFYIESIARTKYGMSKKGETAYQFIDE